MNAALNTPYRNIPTEELLGSPRIAYPDTQASLTLDDPATEVMVDFRASRPSVISGDLPLHDARALMRTTEESIKLVVNRAGEFVGIITLKDFLGKKALAKAHAMSVRLDAVQVKDIMQRTSQVPSIHTRHLRNVKVGDIVETFNQAQSEHFLIFENDSEHPDRSCLRGLISASDVALRLNISLESMARAKSFSDIVHAVNGTFD